MKVKDLIELLSKVSPDTRLVIDGIESGYDEISKVKYIKIAKDYERSDNCYFDGEFYLASEDDISETAIYIS